MAPQHSKKIPKSNVLKSIESAAPPVEATASKPEKLVAAPPVVPNVENAREPKEAVVTQPVAVDPKNAVTPPAKRRPAPSCASGKVKQQDSTNEVVVTLCHGSVFVTNALKAKREPAFKNAFKKSVLDENDSTKELEIISVVPHKKEPTLDSKPVTVGKNDVPDSVFVSFHEEGDNTINNTQGKLVKYPSCFQKYTPAYNSKSSKP